MNCTKQEVVEFIDLGSQPSGNLFITENTMDGEALYPLRMGVCTDCWQAQLIEHVGKSLLFDDHPYLTGTNLPMVDHFKRLAFELRQRYSMTQKSIVLDIGCNDGTFLDQFKDLGITTVGVEPSERIASMANEKGHLIVNKFWNQETATAFQCLGIHPKVITAMSVFYHVSDLHDFLTGIELIMGKESIFVIQAVSLLSLLKNNQFDHFYHEHTCIHSLSSLNNLVASHKLKVIDIVESDVHGGSFIASLALENSTFEVSPNVNSYLTQELKGGLQNLDTYVEFGKRAKNIAKDLKSLLIDLKLAGQSVVGLGAPLKSSTFLNFADIDNTLIECLTEVNPLKINKLSPGKHIPVIAEETLIKEPDYYVVFAWNYLDFLITKKSEYLRKGGKFIVPFPSLRVVTINDL